MFFSSVRCLFCVLFFHWSCSHGRREWEHSSPNPCSTWCVIKEGSPPPHPAQERCNLFVFCIFFKIFYLVEYLYVLWYTSAVLNYLVLSRRCLGSKIELSGLLTLVQCWLYTLFFSRNGNSEINLTSFQMPVWVG